LAPPKGTPTREFFIVIQKDIAFSSFRVTNFA
jgi:hypothetical protein